MQKYESYATRVLTATFGDRFSTEDLVFSFGRDAGTGRIDGIIDGVVAVEFGVGSPKQTRASVLDLIFHPLAKKLLVVVDTPGHAADRTVFQAATILGRSGCGGVVYRLPAERRGSRLERRDLADAVDQHLRDTDEQTVRVLDPAQGVDTVLLFDEATAALYEQLLKDATIEIFDPGLRQAFNRKHGEIAK